jgi:hypothetical protein
MAENLPYAGLARLITWGVALAGMALVLRRGWRHPRRGPPLAACGSYPACGGQPYRRHRTA